MLYRSRYAKYYQRSGDVSVFHALTMEVLFGSKDLLDILLAFPTAEGGPPTASLPEGSEETVSLLREKKILLGDPVEDETLLSEFRTRARSLHRGQIQLMYLLTHADCNLRCTYCFVGQSCNSAQSRMSCETARKAVQYFFRHSQKIRERRIIFYGGEPLLNPEALLAAADEAISLSEKVHGKIDLTLITNGLLLTKSLAQELLQRQIKVSVSIDGPEEVHDAYRKTRGGGPTYKEALRALRTLQELGGKPSVSCTITPVSLERWDEVVNLIIDELKVQGLGFNILIPGSCAEAAPHYVDALQPTTAILHAFERFRELGIYEDRMGRRVKPFISRSFHFKDCLGVGGQIAVAPDGSIGPCQGLLGEREYFPLNLSDDDLDDPFKNSLFSEWVERCPLNFDECLECPAISICGGGCPLAALREEGTIWKIDRRICSQVKPIHEWLMWDLFANAKEDIVQ